MTEIILSVKDLFYSVQERSFLSGKRKNIINGISFEVYKGEILGIAGESGGGKTTLVKLLTGIVKPTSGNIKLKTEKKNKSNPVQILFQNNGQLINPYRKVDEIVEEALSLANTPESEIGTEKNKIFSEINLPEELGKHKGTQLSGGQIQKAALARLLAVHPEILILDEPFSAQDFESQKNLTALLKKINKDLNITLICVSHDLNALRTICDRVAIIFNGKIVEIGKTKEVLSSPEHPYTQYLIKSENYDLTHKELLERVE